MASAQVKSCVLLAGLVTERTTVIEPVACRDHTERLLLRAGAQVRRERRPAGAWQTVVGGADELELEPLEVPGDMSSAAFLIAAGVLVAGSRLVLEGVGVNWTRTGFLRILARMGAIVLGELEPEDSPRSRRWNAFKMDGDDGAAGPGLRDWERLEQPEL